MAHVNFPVVAGVRYVVSCARENCPVCIRCRRCAAAIYGDWAGQSWAEEPVAEPGRARVQGRLDLIMGSDILYERDEGGALAGYIARHAQLHCKVLMVDPNRGNRPAFSKHMAGLGFKLDDQPLRSLAHDTEKYSGHLLRHQR